MDLCIDIDLNSFVSGLFPGNGGKYLHNERCHDDCTHVPELVQYFHGSYGSECRAAFTCTDRVDESGNRCKCPRSLGDCSSCSHTTSDVICLN